MTTTSVSLLERLQNREADRTHAWNRFIDVYSPLLFDWCVHLHVPITERDDVVQNALVKILRSISSFQRSTAGDFRKWLFVVLRNSWLDRCRVLGRERVQPLDATEMPVNDDALAVWTESEFREYALRRVHDFVVADFPLSSQQVFQQYIIEGRPADEVAQALGTSANAVYQTSRRILKRIREELAEILD